MRIRNKNNLLMKNKIKGEKQNKKMLYLMINYKTLKKN